jgi:hypothetical protein
MSVPNVLGGTSPVEFNVDMVKTVLISAFKTILAALNSF